MIKKAREHAEELTAKLVQRLIDRELVETSSISDLREAFVNQLQLLGAMDEFDVQLKIAPVRTLVQDPNIISLFLTQYIIEDLIDHPAILDIFGEDLEIYLATDSVFRVLRPM